MIPAFWDASALVPLCVDQRPSLKVAQVVQQYSIVVWWSTPVEVRSAFERLVRTGSLTPLEHAFADSRYERLRQSWREITPSDALRKKAERLLAEHTLKAADALQHAAALTWSSGSPQSFVFISGDRQLLEAARRAGFQVAAV